MRERERERERERVMSSLICKNGLFDKRGRVDYTCSLLSLLVGIRP